MHFKTTEQLSGSYFEMETVMLVDIPTARAEFLLAPATRNWITVKSQGQAVALPILNIGNNDRNISTGEDIRVRLRIKDRGIMAMSEIKENSKEINSQRKEKIKTEEKSV